VETPEFDVIASATIPWTVQRVTEAGAEAEQLRVVAEEPLIIEVNGQEAATLMRLPGWEKELAVGFCLSEGLIADVEAIHLVHHCGRGLPAPGEEVEEGDGLELASRNRVQIQAAEGSYKRRGADEVMRLVRAGCGAVGVELGDLDLPPVCSELRIGARTLLKLNAALRQGQELFQDVGGVHAAALFDAEGRVVVIREDIGRHNAVDKVLGHCLLRRIPLHDKIILTTGRTSYEMVSKAVRVGLPILASVSTPTALAVHLAEAYRCTVIGYMRSNRFSVYTHGWRVSD
jgi:FdhD protein